MTKVDLGPRLRQELKDLANQGLASGEFLTHQQIDEHLGRFRARFGPDQLRNADGEALLRLMHGPEDIVDRSLVYWLEYKSDDEFRGTAFGGIAGGAASKFGMFQRARDNIWVDANHEILTIGDAIALARQQRNELLAGDVVLSQLSPDDTSDETYLGLQRAMESAAPKMSQAAWARKYWALLHANKLDDFHSPRYQRYHIFKMLQRPPDGSAILDDAPSRFVCAGRFINAARELGVPVNTLTSALVKRNGGRRHYWRIGTTAGGGAGESQWPMMRDGRFVSIGWSEQLPDLSTFIGQTEARDKVRTRLLPVYDNASTASRKAGEVMKFVETIAEGDLVLACDGQEVLGIGRVVGGYRHDDQLDFPHLRPVDWLALDPWQMPAGEGLRTTVYELGRHPGNLAEIEQRIFQRKPIAASATSTAARSPATASAPAAIASPPLDPFTARVEAILRRKGQAIFYGPPGTGKTYRALAAAQELAAGRAFRKRYKGGDLTEAEKKQIDDPAGLVRVCTFHPGYGYEDFIEGFRPDTATTGHLTFERRDGIPLGPWLEALNSRVRRHLKRDARNLQVGHAYLLPATSMAEFARVLRDDIIPLLEEYCYEDFEALAGILGNDIVDAANGRIREEIFEPEREERLAAALMFDDMQRTAAAEPAEEPNAGDDEDDENGTTV